MTSVDEKGTVVSVNCLNKDIKKRILKISYFLKLYSLIEINHRINVTSDHSVSNNLLKSHLNAKSFSMFLTLQQLQETRRCCFSVCLKGDVNVQG